MLPAFLIAASRCLPRATTCGAGIGGNEGRAAAKAGAAAAKAAKSREAATSRGGRARRESVRRGRAWTPPASNDKNCGDSGRWRGSRTLNNGMTRHGAAP